jgi:hypothetical protein
VRRLAQAAREIFRIGAYSASRIGRATAPRATLVRSLQHRSKKNAEISFLARDEPLQ